MLERKRRCGGDAAATAPSNGVEWFNSGVYSYLAVMIGSSLFFSGNPAASTISVFASFTLAFPIRGRHRTAASPARLRSVAAKGRVSC